MEEFVAGTVSGCAGVAIGHPFDTVKVRLQNTREVVLGPKPVTASALQLTGHLMRPGSALECAVTTVKQEGLRGLFRGLMPPVISSAPINSVVFGSYGFMRKQLSQSEEDVHNLSLGRVALAGCFAGTVSTFLATPFELVKVKMQSDRNSGVNPTAWGTVRRVLAREGARGLFRGFNETLARESISYGLYFATYEGVLRALATDGCSPSAMTTALAGGAAGVAVWGPVLPIDVIKTRIQASSVETTAAACAREIYLQEGLRGFFRGMGPTLLRAAPVNAVTFLVFEWTMTALEVAKGRSVLAAESKLPA